jgi:hypothetical protein
VSLQTTRHEIHGAQTPNAASDSFFSKKTLTGLDRSFLSRKSDDGKAVGPCKRHVLKYSKMHIAMSILLCGWGKARRYRYRLKNCQGGNRFNNHERDRLEETASLGLMGIRIAAMSRESY